jgi:hypothetical protein
MQTLEMSQNEVAVMALNEERKGDDSRRDWDQGLTKNMSKRAYAELIKQYRHLTKVSPYMLWLDWATTRFRFIGPASCYTGSNSLLRPVLSSPAHGSISLAMGQI